MLSLWKDLQVGGPSTRLPIDATMFILYILPLIVFNSLAAVLAVTHRARTARVAVWVVICLLAWRAVVSVDLSLPTSSQKLFNTSLMSFMFCVVVRTLDWTLEEPLRHLRPKNSVPASTTTDVIDLITNLRGHGWNLSHGMYIPRETRPTNDRIAFALCTLRSLVVHTLVSGVLHRAILSFSGIVSTIDSQGPTIIDASLPFFVRYLRAGIITVFTAFVAYASMQLGYDLCTIPAVLFLGQDPTQWPPAFDAPWFATSLHDFWGRRWHQWHRRELVVLGGYPLAIFFGPAGAVLGTFLASAVMHDVVLLSLDGRMSPWWMLVGFGMMGPGMLAERAFYRMTGKRMGGIVGWVWTMVWLVLLGGVMVEGCARAGGIGDGSFIDVLPPVRVLVERRVIDFDVWLHTI